jgi:hypothetical protein
VHPEAERPVALTSYGPSIYQKTEIVVFCLRLVAMKHINSGWYRSSESGTITPEQTALTEDEKFALLEAELVYSEGCANCI